MHGIFVWICCLLSVCMADHQCGGTCQDWRFNRCTSGYETGLCDGNTDRRCCLACNAACQALEDGYDDANCEGGKGGVCMMTSNYCPRGYLSGLCGGPSGRKCCRSGSPNACTLESYSSSYIAGYNGLDVKVHSDFVPLMNNMNDYAISCGVAKVWITNAFRVDGQNLGGTVVPPASNSNHLVGHAIDFNVDTTSGWCNSVCLKKRTNSDADCFVEKVRSNSGLRWGGDFSASDPVHIDDGLNLNNPDKWENLYYQLQDHCQ